MEILTNLSSWQVFVALAVALSVAEIFVPGFVLLPMGVGCLLAAPFAFFVDSLVVQIAFLCVTQLAVFLALRKWRPPQTQPVERSNAEGMIGKECQVIASIARHAPGSIKLHGDEWVAVSRGGESFEKGSWVKIVGLEGNKVVVEKLNSEGVQK